MWLSHSQLQTAALYINTASDVLVQASGVTHTSSSDTASEPDKVVHAVHPSMQEAEDQELKASLG